MKFTKFALSIALASTVLTALPSAAGSIGRSGGSSFSRSSSSSSVSRPSAPAPRAAPRSTGIGGGGSMGVRKSEVTQPIANKVNPPPARPAQPTGYNNQQNSGYSQPQQQFAPPAPSGGSGFLGAMGGGFVGSAIGSSLFGNHGSGGTTVVNNGGGAGGGGSAAPAAGGGYATGMDTSGGSSSIQPYSQAPKSSYGIGSFIVDVLLFALLVVVLVGLAILFYKGYQKMKAYVQRERGVAPTQPIQPTAQFWEIQKAFAEADVEKLKSLLGPDLYDEATSGLEVSTLALSNVSHEVALSNGAEFSVHYTFTDSEDLVNQVWHYELHGGAWKLNGIETI